MLVKQIKNNLSQNLAYFFATKLTREPIKEFMRIGEGSNKRFAYKLIAGNKAYKMYEALSVEKAKEIVAISNFLLENNINIPKCFCSFGRYVLAEWIDGNKLSRRNTEHLRHAARYQAQIHAVALNDRWNVTEFKHLMWLIDYFIKVTSKFYNKNRVIEITDSIMRLQPPALVPRIVNPDFTCRNLVLDQNGKMFVYDNEFLYRSIGFEYDIYNMIRVSLRDDDLTAQYLDEYQKVAPLDTFYRDIEYWAICYDLKVIRQKLKKGKIAAADEILRALEEKLASREVTRLRT